MSTSETYTHHNYIADNLRVTPAELLAGCQAILSDDEATTERMDEFAEEAGLGHNRAALEEVVESTRFIPEDIIEPRILVMSSCAMALSASVHVGKISHHEAQTLVEQSIIEESRQNFFKSYLYRGQADLEYDQKHYRAAIKLARKAIHHAVRSKDPGNIITARNHEAYFLYEAGNVAEAVPKLKRLWELMEAHEEDPALKDHALRQSVLRMWRSSLWELGRLEGAVKIHEIMYDQGYVKDTGDEYRERVAGRQPSR